MVRYLINCKCMSVTEFWKSGHRSRPVFDEVMSETWWHTFLTRGVYVTWLLIWQLSSVFDICLLCIFPVTLLWHIGSTVILTSCQSSTCTPSDFIQIVFMHASVYNLIYQRMHRLLCRIVKHTCIYIHASYLKTQLTCTRECWYKE